MEFAKKTPFLIMILAILALLLLFASYRSYYNLFHAFDTGLYLQLAINFWENNSVASSLVGEENFLSHHFQPTFLFFSPFISWFPYSFTLSLLSWTCLFLSLAMILKLHPPQNNYHWALIFCFIASPSINSRIWLNFSPDILALPAWTYLAIQLSHRRFQNPYLWVFCLLWAGGCKENFWLTGLFITLLGWIKYPNSRLFFSLASLCQLLAFVFLFFYWMPAHSNLKSYYGLSYFLGPEYSNAQSIQLSFVMVSLIVNIMSLKSLKTLLLILLSSGVFHPKLFHKNMLPIIPGLLLVLGSVSPQIHSPFNQYWLPILPFLIIGALSIKTPFMLRPKRVSYFIIFPCLFLLFYMMVDLYRGSAPFSYSKHFNQYVQDAYHKHVSKNELLIIDGILQPLVPMHQNSVILLSFWGNPYKLKNIEEQQNYKVITYEKLHLLRNCHEVEIARNRLLFDYQYFTQLCLMIKENGELLKEYKKSPITVYEVNTKPFSHQGS